MILTLDLLSQIQLKYFPFIVLVIFSWQEKVWRISALQVSWMIHEKIFIQVVRAIQTLFASTDINQLKSLRECKNNCMLMRPPMVWLISTHALIPQIQLKYFPFVDQISSGHMFNLKFPWSCQLVVSHDNSLFSHKFKETICSFNTTSVPRDHPLSQTMAFLWFLLYTPSASVPLPSSWCK